MTDQDQHDVTDTDSGRAADSPTDNSTRPNGNSEPPREDTDTDGETQTADVSSDPTGSVAGDDEGIEGHPAASERDLETVDPAALKTSVIEDIGDFFSESLSESLDPAHSGRLRDRLPRFWNTDGSSPLSNPPGGEFIADRWFDFSFLSGEQILQHYWVNEPYAHVTVLYNEGEKRNTYHVSQPQLNEFERHVRQHLIRIVRNTLMYRDIDEEDDREQIFAKELRRIVDKRAATVDPGTAHKVAYYLVRDFLHYGQIDPLMRDPGIEDISCDGVDIPVYIYHGEYRDLRTNIAFDAERLNSLVVRFAQLANKHISVSEPLVDGTLPDGSRIQLTLGSDVGKHGSNFTIRRFSDVPLTPVHLINWGTFNIEQMAYFWLAIENGRSLIFAGGTGSGKTTSMNAVSFFIPPDSKVVSIEDTPEITLPHENWVSSVTRSSASGGGQGEVGTYELLQAALRQRPEYILVGEVRTDPKVALTFFQAIGTGHTAYTTFHADAVPAVLSRLQNPPLEIPGQMIQELDIISIQKQVFKGRDRVRRNDTVTEILESEDPEDVETREIFDRDAASDTFERVHDSQILEDIAQERGWDETTLQREVQNREQVFRYLLEREIMDYQPVAATIQTFNRDPEYVLDRIERDALDPYDLPTDL